MKSLNELVQELHQAKEDLNSMCLYSYREKQIKQELLIKNIEQQIVNLTQI